MSDFDDEEEGTGEEYTWEEAIEDLDKTLELIAEIENEHERTWEWGEDFLSDVRDHMNEVRETIAHAEHVTPKQANAIAGWGQGVRKWHPEHKE